MNLHPVLRWFLWPVSLLYQLIVRARVWCYRRGVFRQRRLPGIVISVGNLTVGGTGKTPMVMWMVERLLAEGKRVGILSRGYRGGGRVASHGVIGSDEMAMVRGRLGAKAQYGVGADRYAKGQMLARHGVEWFLLDDGFQHPRLARDVDIVLLDATDPFGGGHLLPAGRLREPRPALARADIVVITRSDHAPAVEALARRYTTAPIFYAWPELRGLFDIHGDFRAPAYMSGRDKKLFAFCAIGNSRAFFEDLCRWGLEIVGEAAFRDHHRYTDEDAAALARTARASGAEAFVCTEKDAWNDAGRCAGSLPVLVCRVDLHVFEADKFWQTVLETAERRRAGAEP